MHKRWFVIVNALAGGGIARRSVDRVRHALKVQGVDHRIATTNSPAQAREVIFSARSEGFTRFISAGGDGTHHAVVNGLLECFHETPVLALLPLGTGNDWAKTHRIPLNIGRSCQMLSRENTMTVAVGKLHFPERQHTVYFANVAGLCLDAHVVSVLSQSTLARFGKIVYLLTGLFEMFRYAQPHLRLHTREKQLKGRYTTVHAGVGKYCGGGMAFLPHADPAGTKLAVTTVPRMSHLRLLGNIPGLYTGTILSRRDVEGWMTQKVTVSGVDGERIPVEADGELLGVTPVEISVVPNAIHMVTGL